MNRSMQGDSAHLNGPLGHVAEEGQVAQDVKGHGRAPNGALTRQAPLSVVYRTAVSHRDIFQTAF